MLVMLFPFAPITVPISISVSVSVSVFFCVSRRVPVVRFTSFFCCYFCCVRGLCNARNVVCDFLAIFCFLEGSGGIVGVFCTSSLFVGSAAPLNSATRKARFMNFCALLSITSSLVLRLAAAFLYLFADFCA